MRSSRGGVTASDAGANPSSARAPQSSHCKAASPPPSSSSVTRGDRAGRVGAALFDAFAPNEVRRHLTAALAHTHGGKAEREVRVVISDAEGRLKKDKS